MRDRFILGYSEVYSIVIRTLIMYPAGRSLLQLVTIGYTFGASRCSLPMYILALYVREHIYKGRIRVYELIVITISIIYSIVQPAVYYSNTMLPVCIWCVDSIQQGSVHLVPSIVVIVIIMLITIVTIVIIGVNSDRNRVNTPHPPIYTSHNTSRVQHQSSYQGRGHIYLL